MFFVVEKLLVVQPATVRFRYYHYATVEANLLTLHLWTAQECQRWFIFYCLPVEVRTEYKASKTAISDARDRI